MKLKSLALGCMLSCALPLFSQNESKLNVYSDAASFLGFKPAIGHVKTTSKSIESSFLFGAYTIKMENVNDSIYQETITRKFPLKKAKEIFSYVKRNEQYVLIEYDVPYGLRRREKDSLLDAKIILNKEVLTPVDAMNNLVKGKTNNSLSFFIMGCSYSVNLEKNYFYNYIKYSADLNKVTEPGEDDGILFDSMVEVDVSKRGLEKFVTTFKAGKESSRRKIEGKRTN